MRALLAAGLTSTVVACSGPTIPPQATAGGGSAGVAGGGTGGGGAAAGASGTSSGGTSSGGTSGGGAAGGTSSGGGGAAGGGAAGGGAAGGGTSGAAGHPPVVEAACDFSGAGTSCIRCGGTTCVDTHTSADHCGACGHACGAGVACRNGVCGGQTIVTAPTSYTSGVLFQGRLFAWGANGGFQTGGGAGTPFWIFTPKEATAFGGSIVHAQTAGSTFVVDAAGDVRAVGWNGQGQLGTGQSGGPDVCVDQGKSCHATPVKASEVTGVVELRFGDQWCGGAHACARHGDRTVSCWGDLAGGCGTPTTVVVPQTVVLPPSAGLAVTYTTQCSRACDGSVSCWGRNDRKQLGLDAPPTSSTPLTIPGLRLTQIAAGSVHFCGIDEAGDVLCWGAGDAGQTGTLVDTLPTKVPGMSHAVQLALGHSVSCALTDVGEVKCWGMFTSTGVPDKPASCVQDACPEALAAAATGIVEVGGGAGAILARRSDGTFLAWGNNSDAMLGDGTKSAKPTQTPVKVVGLPPVE